MEMYTFPNPEKGKPNKSDGISDRNYNPIESELLIKPNDHMADVNRTNVVANHHHQQQQQQQQQPMVGHKQLLETNLDKKDFEQQPTTELPPKDRLQLVYILFIIHGIGTLMPWNMFITANDYFSNYKLMTVTANGTKVPSVYHEYFLSYLGFTSQVPNVLFSLLNIFVHFGGSNFTVRIVTAIVVEVIIIVITIFLALLDTQEWISGFFYSTMACVVVLNIANAIYQNSLYGLASAFPMRYTNAIVLGSNISGTFTSVVNIISIALAPNLRTAAVYYFLSALVVLLVCLDTYLAFPLIRFFKHYTRTKKDAKTRTSETTIELVDTIDGQSRYLVALKYCWKQCLNVFMVFFVTLAVFPVILANIEPNDPSFFGTEEATKTYFSPVCCFLIFNTCAMIGNIIPSYIQVPGPDRLWIPVVLRFLFIPFFLMCNFHPSGRVYPVLVQYDWVYVLGGIVMGLSSGYLSSLSMMYASSNVPSKVAGTAGMMAAACLVIGIFVGINSSSGFMWLMKHKLF